MSTRVLVADDAPFIREVLLQLLSRNDFQVIAEAGDGEEAIELALQHRPDLILMDIVMPKKSGLQATQEILKIWPEAVILAFSTESNEHLVMKALEAGCRDYIVKPFHGAELIQQLDRFRRRQLAGA